MLLHEKWGKVIALGVELATIGGLLYLLSDGGFAAVLGAGVLQVIRMVAEFGISIMAVFGVLVAWLLKSRRHRILRDTQYQIFKYALVLGLFQVLTMTLTGGLPGSSFALPKDLLKELPSGFLSVLSYAFYGMAIMIPFNYIKNLISSLKAVEHRNPQHLIRQIFS